MGHVAGPLPVRRGSGREQVVVLLHAVVCVDSGGPGAVGLFAFLEAIAAVM